MSGDDVAASVSSAAVSDPDPVVVQDEDPPARLFTFPSHQSHMLNLAKMCKQNKEFTDCVIQCVDGGGGAGVGGKSVRSPCVLRAHRLVLGAASKFLRRVFDETPPALSESTLVVPGVRASVVEALIEFLYSGEMRVRRADTADLQLLIETLQIDPELISVEEEEEEEEEGGNEEDDKTDDKRGESEREEVKDDRPIGGGRKRKAEEEADETEEKKVEVGEQEGLSKVKRPK